MAPALIDRIFLASDMNYLRQTLALLYNIKANVTRDVEIVLVLSGVHQDIQGKTICFLKNLSAQKFKIRPFFLSELEQEDLLSDFIQNPNLRITKTTFLRLFCSVWLPSNTRSLLYLDSDTLICGNIDELISYLPKLTVAATPNPWSVQEIESVLGSDFRGRYFNAGVMKINWTRWGSLNYEKKIKESVKGREESYIYNDQDILNLQLSEDWEVLDSMYNFLVNDPKISLFPITKAPKIIHFAGVKPWEETAVTPFVIKYRNEFWRRLHEIEEALGGH